MKKAVKLEIDERRPIDEVGAGQRQGSDGSHASNEGGAGQQRQQRHEVDGRHEMNGAMKNMQGMQELKDGAKHEYMKHTWIQILTVNV